jgi:hypothetical protein
MSKFSKVTSTIHQIPAEWSNYLPFIAREAIPFLCLFCLIASAAYGRLTLLFSISLNGHYGWIAFYNHDIFDLSLMLFHSFRNSAAQCTFEEDAGYSLSQLQADELLHLENQLNHAIGTLCTHYHLLGLPLCSPWASGYLPPGWKCGSLSLCMEKTRNWFKVWLCLLSYRITAAESYEVSSVKHLVFGSLVTKPEKNHNRTGL